MKSRIWFAAIAISLVTSATVLRERSSTGDELDAELRMSSDDGSVREEPFRFQRYEP